MGETSALAGSGLVLGAAAGPLGALAGMAIGALAGGKKEIVVFGIVTSSNETAMFKADAAEFERLRVY